ncbi:MAG: CDP-glycerol glycerophosphotransferase family protein, partial [Clostridia bacterium]|nr:CDP-glycerol glycerophosphotransferase family protein [Clostridia bacterium]
MIIQLLKDRLRQLLHGILYLFPISKDKVVFANFLGRGMGGSPKYIAEEMLRQDLPYDMVWLVSDTSVTLPSGIRPVKMFSLRGRYELATAHVIINNVKHKLPFKKKKAQYYIQTWHG